MSLFSKLIRVLVVTGFITSALAQEVSVPDAGLNAAIRDALQKPAGPLTAEDLLSLTNLNADSRNVSSVEGLQAAHNLTWLDLHSNRLANLSFPDGLTNLNLLDLSFNPLTNCILPSGLTSLTSLTIESAQLTNLMMPSDMTGLIGLDLFGNGLSNLALPVGLTNLDFLLLSGNRFTNLTLPAGLNGLTTLEMFGNQLTTFTVPADMTNLTALYLFFNQLTNLTLPPELKTLSTLDLEGNQFTTFHVPPSLSRLSFLELCDNQLTNLTLPSSMTNLANLCLADNHLTNLTLPTGLTKLNFLQLSGNQLTNLTLPPDMTNLTSFFANENPLITFVLSEPLAATSLAIAVGSLQDQGVNVFTYPLTVQLVRVDQFVGAFKFSITGPPGVYTVLQSTDLNAWTALRSVSVPLGAVNFTDGTANLSPQKFYRALLQSSDSALTNMVFIAPNTFTLGSPTNEIGHRSDESPQTTVTLTHGFWMAKFLVTQRDYLAVTGSNPSGFPGDLDRPVETVSWFDATNYCDQLTQQDLAAGRIPPGSHYRLPTEAEWECAARAGTATRFYFGDDVTGLTNRAWYAVNSGLTPRPVGLKLPNAWGLYDMEGNVWEWCEDWYGPYPGGAVTDPQGPASNPIGFKVIRGGAWESSETDCRSARRSIEGASPFITDFIIGFRVVLSLEP